MDRYVFIDTITALINLICVLINVHSHARVSVPLCVFEHFNLII